MANFGKKGVLLVNLGTPDAPTWSALNRYLGEFLTDKRVIDFNWLARTLLVRGIIAPIRSIRISKEYQKLWMEEGSPLKVYGERLTKGVSELLGDDYVVQLAMRYQNPSIPYALNNLLQAGVSEIIIFPLFPQYASATTGSIHELVMKLLAKEETIPDVKMINSYYDYEPMIDIFVDNAKQFDLDSYDHFIFSYHGLPERYLRKADYNNHCTRAENCCHNISGVNQFCYSAQCHATTKALAGKLGLEPGSYTTTFQSRFGPEKWAQPYTSAVLEEQAEHGAKRLLVFSPAFVADCLETLIEISEEYQEEFQEMGGEKVDLVPSLNDDPRWFDAVKEKILAYS